MNRGSQRDGTVRVCEDIRVIDEADVCVVGGSCTGVFAAVRAARLGASVVLVEKQGFLGGTAASVCTWHSLFDTEFKRQIIAGLTQEVIERLRRRDALAEIDDNASRGFEFRPGDLKVVLDEIVLESGVRPRLHTLFSAPVLEEGRLTGVVVDGKSGRGVIRARAFVDATGDGDLCARLGLNAYRYDALLPPTTCAFFDRWDATSRADVGELIRKHGREHGIDPGFAWGTVLPRTDVTMLAGTRVRDVDCSDADDLTRAEIEGRRQVNVVVEILRAHRGDLAARLFDFPAQIGVRDTRHIECVYRLTGDDVLTGRRFDDAIANGSYRVDIHHQDRPGITFMYLDGRTSYLQPGFPAEAGRWREPAATDPTFYPVPLRSLIPPRYDNLILAGRMLDADKTAFSAVRVMVNTNQMGEAAGVAAHLSLSTGLAIGRLDPVDVRAQLSRGGSIVV